MAAEAVDLELAVVEKATAAVAAFSTTVVAAARAAAAVAGLVIQPQRRCTDHRGCSDQSWPRRYT